MAPRHSPSSEKLNQGSVVTQLKGLEHRCQRTLLWSSLTRQKRKKEKRPALPWTPPSAMDRPVQTSCPAPPRPAPRHAGTGPARHRRPNAAGGQRDPQAPVPPSISAPKPPTLAHLRSAFSSGLRCVRRCRLRAWGGTPLAPSGLAPCWPGTMTGRARPAGAPATAAGWPDRRSTWGAPAAGLCAGATTTMAGACLRQCAPPLPSGPAPPDPAFLRSWPFSIGQRLVTHAYLCAHWPGWFGGAGPGRPLWPPRSYTGGAGAFCAVATGRSLRAGAGPLRAGWGVGPGNLRKGPEQGGVSSLHGFPPLCWRRV